MVILGSALDMMLLWVSAIIFLELLALSVGLGALGTPKMSPCSLNVGISLIVARILHISASYGPIELYFGSDALVGLCYYILRAHDPINRIRGPWSP